MRPAPATVSRASRSASSPIKAEFDAGGGHRLGQVERVRRTGAADGAERVHLLLGNFDDGPHRAEDVFRALELLGRAVGAGRHRDDAAAQLRRSVGHRPDHRLPRGQGGFELGDGDGGCNADHDRIRRKGATDFPGQLGNAHRLHAENHDAGTLRRLLVVVGFFAAGNGRYAGVPFGQLRCPLRAADGGHDLHGIRAALQQAAQNGLVH
jgi:hypothetical protein